MATCQHSKWAGFVTNQDPDQPLDLNRAHMSQVTCDRPACIEETKRAVEFFTAEPARFYPYAERRAARAGGQS